MSAKLPRAFTHDGLASIEASEAREAFHKHLRAFTPLESNHKLAVHLVQLSPQITYPEHFAPLKQSLEYWQEWRVSEGAELLGGALSDDNWIPVVEFRHASWNCPEAFQMLRETHAGYCTVVEPELPAVFEPTRSDLLYVRFHGYGNQIWWNYQFTSQELQQWAYKVQDAHSRVMSAGNRRGRVFVYYNNHFSGYAVKNAQEFQAIVDGEPARISATSAGTRQTLDTYLNS
jgi:uncharacterized protein YecE (DUF72 family)